MKSKLLRGIVKDLMKFPIGEKKMGGAEAPPSLAPHEKAGVSIMIHTSKPGVAPGVEPEHEEIPDENEGPGMEGSNEDPLTMKKLSMNKAIHAKMKGKLV